MAVGFPAAILTAVVFGLAVRALDRVPAVYQAGVRPVTDFVSHPDLFTVVVASLAGIAGTLSLTEAKAGTLVGVLVDGSVGPRPARANANRWRAVNLGEHHGRD